LGGPVGPGVTGVAVGAHVSMSFIPSCGRCRYCSGNRQYLCNEGAKLFEVGVHVVGVPKTIDNDLGATDQTFGFDTAVQTAVEAIDRLPTPAESQHRGMVGRGRGRHAAPHAPETPGGARA